MKKFLFIGILFISISCEMNKQEHLPTSEFIMTFQKDSHFDHKSFEPTKKDTKLFEEALLKNLKQRTESGKGLKRSILDKVEPLEYNLGFFKRRYFGRIYKNKIRKIYVEMVFVRCGGSEEWKQLNYPTESNIACWWSAEYNLKTNKIETINYH